VAVVLLAGMGVLALAAVVIVLAALADERNR
jgi:CHASE1-domain containing sensor protein